MSGAEGMGTSRPGRPRYNLDPKFLEVISSVSVRALMAGPVGASIRYLLDNAETVTEALERARDIRGKHHYGGEQWHQWQAVVSLLEVTSKGEE